MGQRLTVNLWYKGSCVAAMYQHWSAYTHCSYEVVEEVLSGFEKAPESYDEAVLVAMKMLQCCPGATINHNSYSTKDLNKEFRKRNDLHKQIRALGRQFPKKCDRSDGLIVVGEKAEDVSTWGEYSVYIDLDAQTVEFCVWCIYNDYDDCAAFNCYGSSCIIKPHRIVLTEELDPTNFHFDEIDEITSLVNDICNGCSYEFIMPDGRVLSAIA